MKITVDGEDFIVQKARKFVHFKGWTAGYYFDEIERGKLTPTTYRKSGHTKIPNQHLNKFRKVLEKFKKLMSLK